MPVQYVLSCPKVTGHSNGWSDIPSKKESNKKGGEKMMGGKKKKKEKKGRKKKEKRRSQQNKRKEREGRGEEDRMKKTERKKKEKRVGIKFLNKRKYCVGTEPSALVYICILVTSTTTGHDGSVVSALASQQKVGVQFPVMARAFFPTSIFYLPFPTSLGK